MSKLAQNEAFFAEVARKKAVASNPASTPDELLAVAFEFPELVLANPVLDLLALEDPEKGKRIALTATRTAAYRDVLAARDRLNPGRKRLVAVGVAQLALVDFVETPPLFGLVNRAKLRAVLAVARAYAAEQVDGHVVDAVEKVAAVWRSGEARALYAMEPRDRHRSIDRALSCVAATLCSVPGTAARQALDSFAGGGGLSPFHQPDLRDSGILRGIVDRVGREPVEPVPTRTLSAALDLLFGLGG